MSLTGTARNSDFKLIGLGAVALTASVLILLGDWEIGGESWYSWMWARNLAENGTFNIASRSAIYALYLNAFTWLGYPVSVTAEHLVSGLIVVAAMVTLFRSYVGAWLALLTALLWLPFLQIAEPAVQKLALAFVLWALYFRTTGTGSARIGGSYALLVLAGMFRMPYFLFVMLFALWDARQVLKRGQFRGLPWGLPSIRAFSWPIVPVAGLLIWILLAQSPHPWNNIWSSSTMWLPLDNPKSFSESVFIGQFNSKYIESEYGTNRDRDWYFTNDEVFDGQKTVLGAIRANPSFVIRELASNVKPAIFVSAKFSDLAYLPLLKIYDSLVLLAIFLGAFFATKNASIRIFVIGSIVLHAASIAVVAGPYRHFVPFVPVLILAAYFYGSRLRALMTADSEAPRRWLLRAGLLGVALTTAYVPLRIAFAPQDASRLASAAISACIVAVFLIAIGAYRVGIAEGGAGRLFYGRVLGVLALIVPLVFLSTGATTWTGLARDFVEDARRGDIRVLEYSEAGGRLSMKASFEEMKPLVARCAGIMTREHTFIAAFMDVPLDKLYDVMEIPPFGRLGDSEYDGLRPDRIDCVLVSDLFATKIGSYTNLQMRYENYVEPYAQQLREMGATTYDIERFGQAVILPK